MGFDLMHKKSLGKDAEFSINWTGWRLALEIAEKYGWKPEGTVMEENFLGTGDKASKVSDENKNWNGTYYSNDFQRVTEADASKLGKALKRAVTKKRKLTNLSQDAIDWVDYLDKLADFCLAGDFLIY